jgi:hypothetical protein
MSAYPYSPDFNMERLCMELDKRMNRWLKKHRIEATKKMRVLYGHNQQDKYHLWYKRGIRVYIRNLVGACSVPNLHRV